MISPVFGIPTSPLVRIVILNLLFTSFFSSCNQKNCFDKAEPSNVIVDKQVESLLNQSKYRDAARFIGHYLRDSSTLDPSARIYYFNKMSFAQLRLRNLDSAMLMARKSLALLPEINDSGLVSDAWRMAAYSFNNIGKLDSALYFTRLLLDYSDRNGDIRQKRNALVSIATILSQNREFGQALTYYREAERLTETLRDTLYVPISDYNIGLTFLNLKQTDSCLFYLMRAEKTASQSDRGDILVYIYGTMADCYLSVNKLNQRKHYLMLANEEAEKIGNRQFLAMGLSNLAQGALEQKNFKEALSFGEQSLKLLKEQPYPVLKMKVDSMQAVAYEGIGNHIAALKSLHTYIAEREQIVGRKQSEQLNQLRVLLEVKEKDLTITTQKLEISDKKGKIQLLTLVVIVALLLITGQFIYVVLTRAYRRKLFRKEKELDQYTEDLNHWLAWKKESENMHPEGENQSDHAISDLQPKGISGVQSILFSELREIFTSRKLYLDPELNLKTVIKLLGTNKKYLYQAISENSDENFRSFINRYRVDEAKRIMKDRISQSNDVNLSELYSLAGFNSSISLYRAFKAITGLTPKEYLKEIKRSGTTRSL